MIIAGFDLETTGFDGRKDHIVQYSFQIWNDDVRVVNETHLVNPGVPIGNSEIHGVTDDMVIGAVLEPYALDSILSMLRSCDSKDIPVAIMNARFDITFLLYLNSDRAYALPNIIDPYVIDKHLDKWRKGSRKLADIASHYGLSVDESRLHGAGYDVELTVAVARKQLAYVAANPEFLHQCQVKWYDQQAKSLYEYFRRIDNEAYKEIGYGWPVAGGLIHDART